MPMSDKVSVSMKRLAELLMAEEKLSRLEAGGVDAWDWYGDSLNPAGDESLSDYKARVREAVTLGTLDANFR